MLLKWWRQPSRDGNIETIYGVIVAQAREPAFYSVCGVPDTVEGRFDMLVLHLFLYLQRVGKDGMTTTSQAVFDRFCADLDDNLREMGISDIGVPKRMMKFAQAFYGRSGAYERAMTNLDRTAMSQAIARNIFGNVSVPSGAQTLADYAFDASEALAGSSDAALSQGLFRFPIPPAGRTFPAAVEVAR